MTNIERLGKAVARRGNWFQYTMLTAWGYSKPDSWGRVLRTNKDGSLFDLFALQNGRRPPARKEA